MASHSRLPSRDELTQAQSVAWMLRGAYRVEVTERAVYAFGPEAWVCPNCLKPNRMGGRIPMAPMSCSRCDTLLQP